MALTMTDEQESARRIANPLSHDAVVIRKALVAAWAEVDATRAQLAQAARELADERALRDRHFYALAASQASERELREALADAPCEQCAAECDRSPCSCGAVADNERRNAILSRAPGSTEALRAVLAEAESAGFLAGMKAQQFVTGGYGVTEADLVPDSVRVARVLDRSDTTEGGRGHEQRRTDRGHSRH